MGKEEFILVSIDEPENSIDGSTLSDTEDEESLLSSHGYTENEISQMKLLRAEDKVIDEQLKLLGGRSREILMKINAIKKKPDPELQELLNPRLNPNDRHKITCVGIREKGELNITISSCDKPREIEKFFNSFLKNPAKVKKYDTSKRMERDFEISITIKLSERDGLIEGLKLSEEILNLPSAHRYLDGC
ncbi:MAG: hypothetical protein Q8M03_09065 [Legionella sp.]|nr:hypothetical protein [Legionella sp.]